VTTSRSAALVVQHLEAFNTGDLMRLLDGFRPDAVFASGTTVVRGRAEMEEFFGGAIRDLRPSLTAVRMVASDELVACELVEVFSLHGVEHTYHKGGFYRIDGDLIASAKIYGEGSAEI
jgi:hypothetical protein